MKVIWLQDGKICRDYLWRYVRFGAVVDDREITKRSSSDSLTDKAGRLGTNRSGKWCWTNCATLSGRLYPDNKQVANNEFGIDTDYCKKDVIGNEAGISGCGPRAFLIYLSFQQYWFGYFLPIRQTIRQPLRNQIFPRVNKIKETFLRVRHLRL